MTEEAVFVYDRGDSMRHKLATLRARLEELGSYKVHFGDGSRAAAAAEWVLFAASHQE